MHGRYNFKLQHQLDLSTINMVPCWRPVCLLCVDVRYRVGAHESGPTVRYGVSFSVVVLFCAYYETLYMTCEAKIHWFGVIHTTFLRLRLFALGDIYFRSRCIDQWLGNHTSCCVCKADLEEMARVAGKRGRRPSSELSRPT